MSRTNNYLNTLSILTSLFMLALCYHARLNLPAYMSGLNYASLFALAATLFSLPDFICYWFPSENKWYRTSEFYTIFLLLFLGTIGLVLSRYSAWLGFIILPLGLTLTSWELYQFVRSKNLLTLFAGLAFMAFIAFLFYAWSFVSPLFPEQIITGKAHVDTLFLSSMSNMFATNGWPSDGLDGSTFIQYHFGSLALFGGLKNWIGLNSLMFYNVAYPVIFIPLFFKSFFYFLNRLLVYKGMSPVNLLYAIAFFAVMYSLKIAAFVFATPFRFESLNISIIFTFLYAATLFVYTGKPGRSNYPFFFYSIILLLFIATAKISTGVVLIAGMAYLYLRIFKNIKNILLLFVTLILTGAFIYLFIYPSNRFGYTVTIGNRINNIWYPSVSFIHYLLGAFIAIIVILRNQSLENWTKVKSVFLSGKYLDLEILFIITIISFLGGIMVSAFPTDVYMFCAPQFFISVPFLIMYSQKYFDRFTSSVIAKRLFLFLLLFLSFVSSPDTIVKYRNRLTHLKENMLKLSPQQKLLQGFIAELFTLEKVTDKKKTCIYIPKTEKWYYDSQTDRPLGQYGVEPINSSMGSSLVVPAITGIALVGGIPESMFSADNLPNLDKYIKRARLQAKNLAEAKAGAIQKGYTRLIEYQCVDGKLVKQVFPLK